MAQVNLRGARAVADSVNAATLGAMHRLPVRLRLVLVVSALTLGLTGCDLVLSPAPTAMPTTPPTPTATPAPTWTPAPTPTATPIPPAVLTILWPERVSPLEPSAIEADLVPPAGMDPAARLSATVADPEGVVYATFELNKREGNRYRSSERLQLPLEPLSGIWWLVVHVESPLAHAGTPVAYFEVEPVAFRELTGTLPSGVTMRVPLGFEEVMAQGDTWAGGRVWAYENGEVGLWWAPGPTEELLLSNAVVALEATYDADTRYPPPPAPTEAASITWQDRTAFEFAEAWPGADGGPGWAWVIQGPDLKLYILRVRAVGSNDVPPIHLEVVHTFGFPAPSE